MISLLEWSTDGTDWQTLVFDSAPGEVPYTMALTASPAPDGLAPRDHLVFRVTNAVGIFTEASTEIPSSLKCPTPPIEDIIEQFDVVSASDSAEETGLTIDAMADFSSDVITPHDVAVSDLGAGQDQDFTNNSDGGCTYGSGSGGHADSLWWSRRLVVDSSDCTDCYYSP